MKKNSNLKKAKKNKNDEFYTQISDIEKELKYYREHFNGKKVYLNCDGLKSDFWKFFYLNYDFLELTKLTAIHYEENEKTYKVTYDGKQIKKEYLKGNGDFRSDESIEELKSCDIVVTNPPFSLFREFVAQLIEYNKKFLIIGNNNAITYKEIFPLIKNNEIWLGHNSNKTIEFIMPNNYESDKTNKNGDKIGKVPAISWFTNLDNNKRHEIIETGIKYEKKKDSYEFYDNYEALNIDKVNEIPDDYKGIMGVPITFLTKYNPNQFEIIGLLNSSTEDLSVIKPLKVYDDFKEMRQDMSYTGASGKKTNGNPVLKGKSKRGNFF